MSTYAELPPDKQAQIENTINTIFRPAMGEIARALRNLELLKDAYALIEGDMNSLSPTEIIPKTSSGLAGIGDLTSAEIMAVMADVNTILANHYGNASRQMYIKAAGPRNVISG